MFAGDLEARGFHMSSCDKTLPGPSVARSQGQLCPTGGAPDAGPAGPLPSGSHPLSRSWKVETEP